MDKKEKKTACNSIRESLAKHETALALAISEGNKLAIESAKRMISYCEKKLKEIKTQ